jgi:hypothetical protein
MSHLYFTITSLLARYKTQTLGNKVTSFMGKNYEQVYNRAVHLIGTGVKLVYTVEPRFTNASYHEQISSRANFPGGK